MPVATTTVCLEFLAGIERDAKPLAAPVKLAHPRGFDVGDEVLLKPLAVRINRSIGTVWSSRNRLVPETAQESASGKPGTGADRLDAYGVT